MKRIYKYDVAPNPNGFVEIEVPEGTQPRHFGVDGRGVLCLWAEFDPFLSKDRPTETLVFKVVTTGVDFSDAGTYVTSVVIPNFLTTLVLHIYRIG